MVRQAHHEWRATGIGDKVALRVRLDPAGRVPTGGTAPFWAGTEALSKFAPPSVDLNHPVQALQEHRMQVGPHVDRLRVAQTPPAPHPAAAAYLRR